MISYYKIMEKNFYKEDVDMRDTEQKTGVAMEQAENMAEFAGIELQDHDPRVKLYATLRDKTSDQSLFAEVLRILGDTEALNKLIGAYHKMGIHCPICLKVVAPGEECR